MGIVKYCDTNGIPQPVDVTDGSVHVTLTGEDGTPLITDSVPVNLLMHSVSGTLGALNATIGLDDMDFSCGTMVFQVSGTWTGKIVVEGAVDGTYNNLSIVQPGGTIAFTGVNNDNQNGVYRALIISGYTKMRLRMSSYTSGTATIVCNGAPLVATPFVWQLVAANLQTSINAFRSSDSTYQPLRLDKSTNSIQTIDYEHHEIHAGSHFLYTDSVELDNAVAQDYMITTPNTTKWAHMTFLASGSAITTVQVYEAGDRTGTTGQTLYNSDRNRLTASGLTIHKGQSGGTTDGSLIWQRKSGAAAGASRTGAEATRNGELILKQATKYILRITSGTNDNLTNLQLEWYEHTNIA